MMHVQVQSHRAKQTTAAHLVTKVRVRVALRALSKTRTAHARAVAIHADVDANAATKVTVAKKAPTALRHPALPQAHKQAVLRKRHVSRKDHALTRPTLHKPMINISCKTDQKVNPALKTTTIAAIQNANAVVVVAVVANAVKTKGQALRTKMVRQTDSSSSLTLSLKVASPRKPHPRPRQRQHLSKRTWHRLTWHLPHKRTLRPFKQQHPQQHLPRSRQRHLLFTRHLQHPPPMSMWDLPQSQLRRLLNPQR